jgi:hypothetical protein
MLHVAAISATHRQARQDKQGGSGRAAWALTASCSESNCPVSAGWLCGAATLPPAAAPAQQRVKPSSAAKGRAVAVRAKVAVPLYPLDDWAQQKKESLQQKAAPQQEGRVWSAGEPVAAAGGGGGGGGGRPATHQPSTMQRSRSRSHLRSFVSWKQTTSADTGGALQGGNSRSNQATGNSQRHSHRHLTFPIYSPAPRLSSSCERVTPSRFKHARSPFTLKDSRRTLS